MMFEGCLECFAYMRLYTWFLRDILSVLFVSVTSGTLSVSCSVQSAVRAYTYVRVYTSIYVYETLSVVRSYVYIRIYIYMYICVYTRIYIYTYIMRIYTYTWFLKDVSNVLLSVVVCGCKGAVFEGCLERFTC